MDQPDECPVEHRRMKESPPQMLLRIAGRKFARPPGIPQHRPFGQIAIVVGQSELLEHMRRMGRQIAADRDRSGHGFA